MALTLLVSLVLVVLGVEATVATVTGGGVGEVRVAWEVVVLKEETRGGWDLSIPQALSLLSPPLPTLSLPHTLPHPADAPPRLPPDQVVHSPS